MSDKITLIGDSIENPWNALTMVHAAQMFGGDCRFRDRAELERSWQETVGVGALPLIANQELANDFSPIIALDNLENAVSIYGFAPGRGGKPAVVVGNERNGIARDIQALATHRVEIPLASRRLNCINVAAAAAVALYYLSRGGGGKMPVGAHPYLRRPEVLLLGPGDHIELGSTIRSAGAFGWDRVFVQDQASLWFGCERVIRSEGRGAARRGRNPIHVIPHPAGRTAHFSHVTVLTIRGAGTPLHRANLARGSQQLIVIPDEEHVNAPNEDSQRLGTEVVVVSLPLPATDFVYHYRLIASIALAEIARQVGQRVRPKGGRGRRQGPVYDSALKMLVEEAGETVYPKDLEAY